MLLETFRRRRTEKARRPLRNNDPFTDFTSRDWADLPTFHPVADIDVNSR
jgi:hypothetical protein